MPQEWRNGTIVKIKDETYNTRRFSIRVEGIDHFEFTPGQFVTIDLPIDDKPNKRWRSYSIGSCPDKTNIFELLIVLVPDGKGTPFMFGNWKVGDTIVLRGPQGVFTLREEHFKKDIFFICTGTGIAPFRCMLNYIKNNNIPHKNIYLIFGCRTKEDLLYYDEMRNLQLEDFHYMPTLSREEWEGRTGYVHEIYEEHAKGSDDAAFFLCGWKNMIEEARKRIVDMGFDKKSIHFELYG